MDLLRYPRPRVYGVLEDCRPPRHDLKDAESRSAPAQRFRARLRGLSDRAGPAFVERRCLTVDLGVRTPVCATGQWRLCLRFSSASANRTRASWRWGSTFLLVCSSRPSCLSTAFLAWSAAFLILSDTLSDMSYLHSWRSLNRHVCRSRPPGAFALTLWSFSDRWMTRRHAFCVIRKRAAA